MSIKVALAGNPNCGKTTMFNDLTGSSQYVGNWPGVTVEKKEGKLKGHREVLIQDLPGIYSLSPYTLEEVVARDYLVQEKPEAVINLIDGTNLERNLYLTTQLAELGLPMVLALNMIDVVKKRGDVINLKKLGEAFGCEVVETSALKGVGSREVAQRAIDLAGSGALPKPQKFSPAVEETLKRLQEYLGDSVPEAQKRWYAIKVFERDERVVRSLELDRPALAEIEGTIKACEEKLDDDSESIITDERYTAIAAIVKRCYQKRNRERLSASDRVDRIVTNRWLALPIFAAVMFLVYYLSITTVGGWGTDWVNDNLFGEIIPNTFGAWLEGLGLAPWLYSLIMDGIVAGVGAVLGFLPQMLVLFLCLAILEDCGYMARIAFIMDRIFRKFGLSGKSFIPMLIGLGCGVPGVMASRTIENESDRKMTIMTTTFIPCSAKLPIIALIAGALFRDAVWVAPSAYFVGIAAIVCSGIILKKTKAFAGDPAPFVMELPAYHIPGVKNVLLHMWDRTKSFIKKAGTIIFLASALIWFLGSFNWQMEMVDTSKSILAAIGSAIAPLFAPLGWGHWQATVAAFTGLIAKENVVSTFGILYGFEEVAENGAEVWTNVAAAFTQLSAYSFLVFNLLCAPCFAAIGAIHREMGSAKWTWITVGYQTGLAYGVSLMIYQLGMLFTGNGFNVWTAVAILLLVGLLYLLFRPAKRVEKGHLRAVDAVRV